MSFELVNHQIMHMFGGIEAQKNSSLQSLENVQKRVFKAMEKAQQTYKKIYQAANSVKENLLDLSDNYLSLAKTNKHSGKLITKLQLQINEMFQKISEESIALSKKMENKADSYAPNFKKLKEKYTDCADTLEHYKQKVVLLRKNVEKQSLAKIKQDQHERYERNKDKLKKAESDHDQILLKITKRFVQFNNQGIKDLYFDLLSMMSIIGSQMMVAASSITKHLHGSFSTKQILLAREVRTKSREKLNHILTKGGQGLLQQEDQPKYCDNKAIWLDYLIEQNQLSSYLKTLMDREMAKVQPGLQIHDFFNKNLQENHQHQETALSSAFDHLHNQYNSKALQSQHQNSDLRKFKEEDSNDACEDLISVEELTGMSPSVAEIQDSELVQIQYPDFDKKHQKAFTDPEKIKQNLQKFNKICETNKKTNPQHQLAKETYPISNFKSNVALKNHKALEKNQLTVNAGDFFNIQDFSRKKQEGVLPQPQKQLQKLHEHPMYFDFFQNMPVKENKMQIENQRTTNGFASIRKHSAEHLKFESFDFFSKHTSNNTGEGSNKGLAHEVKSSTYLPPKANINSKTPQHSYDLLNL